MTETLAEPRALELLTSSRMRCFRECARKHDLRYVQGYAPVKTAEALRFGSLVHVALEAYWRAIQAWQRDSTMIFVDRLATDAVSDAIAAFPDSDRFEKIRAEEMVAAYIAKWGARDPHEYEVLAVEKRFDAPLLNPETMHASKTWRLAGKVDIVLRRRVDERVLVADHKTTSDEVEGDDATFWAKLVMDFQATQYVLGAESMGYAVDELLWDVLKKPRQRPLLATPLLERKRTKTGELYAKQRAYDETPDEYRVRVREAISAEPDRFIQRRPIPRSNSQLSDFMFSAWAQAGTMRESARLGRAPMNPDACHAWGVCPYWDLCSTGGKPQDYPASFVKLTDVHPELSEEAR